MLPVCVLVAYALGIITTILFHPKTLSNFTFSALKSTITFTPRFGITAPVPIATPFPSVFLEASKSQINSQSGDWRLLVGLWTLSVILVGLSGYLYLLRVQRILEVECYQNDEETLTFLSLETLQHNLSCSKAKIDELELNSEIQSRRVNDLEASKMNNKVNIKNLESDIKTKNQLTIDLESVVSSQNIKINELKPQLETQIEQNAQLLHKQGTDKDTIVRSEAQMRYQMLEKESLERDVKNHQITIKDFKNLKATQDRQIIEQKREIARLKNSLTVGNAEKVEAIEKRQEMLKLNDAREEFWFGKVRDMTEEHRKDKVHYNEKVDEYGVCFREMEEGWEERDKTISIKDAEIKRLEALNDDLKAESKKSPTDDQEAAPNDHPNNAKNRKKREKKKANRRAKANGQAAEADVTDDASGDEAAEVKDGGESHKTNAGTGDVGAKGKDSTKD